MLEANLWKLLKRYAGGTNTTRIMRCENVAATGVPDVNACIEGLELWIELKCPKLHKRASTPVFGGSHKIMPAQFAWLKHQAMAGGFGAVLVCNEELTLLIDGAYLDASINAQTLEQIKQREGIIYCNETRFCADVWQELKGSILRYYHGIN